jgi:hypothetical protein
MGAAHHSLTLGSVVLDLSKATKDELYQARRNLIEGLKANRYFSRGAMKRNQAFRKVA